MKVLIITIAILVLTIVAIVIIGALLPEHHVARSTKFLNTTPDVVFGLISGAQDWRTDLKSYESFEKDGANFRRETNKNGQTLTFETIESVPPRLLKARMADKNLPFGGSWTYQIESRSSGCELSITEEGYVYNPVFRFVSRFVMGPTRTLDNYLAMLAAAVQKRSASLHN